jgi:biopolymer transport protein ExbB
MAALVNLFQTGGMVVSLLVASSVVALSVALWKGWQQWLLRPVYSHHFEHSLHLLEHNDFTEAKLALGDPANPRGELIQTGMKMMTNPIFTVRHIQNELTRMARKYLSEVSAHLKVLEIIALTAPLMGLFGTVLGMIDAFKAMEMAGSQVDPSILSGGIWKALLTTAVGLAVAIPVSLVHTWFESRRDNLAQLFSDDIGRLATVAANHTHTGSAVTKNLPNRDH